MCFVLNGDVKWRTFVAVANAVRTDWHIGFPNGRLRGGILCAKVISPDHEWRSPFVIHVVAMLYRWAGSWYSDG